MDRFDVANGFDFDDEVLVYNNINLIAAIEIAIFIFQRDLLLPSEWEAGMMELETQAFFVDRFEQTRTQMSMDLYRQANDLPRQVGSLVMFQEISVA